MVSRETGLLGVMLRHQGIQRLAGSLIGLYLGAALRTSRWHIDADPATWALLTGQTGQPAIVVFWHEYLPGVPILWWRARRDNASLSLTALISRHRDGRMIAGIMRRWGVGSVDGSSTKAGKADKGGSSALRGMLALLSAGKIVALTPDGPRGPRRVMQPGTAQLAALSGAPVVPIAAICRPALRVASWDRMVVPLPFGRITIQCGTPIAVARRDRETGLAAIAAALDALDHRRDKA